ncbi:RelA/SpoT family protein [Myxococcota bacterium]|nr:RelA/SpoT family protein [Myxococcota bacterium]MBU1381231.1 RelA/SpoT family protein [Myxococcota bacterium]MBU1496930.1 RelA/SpoT family protein [Myxococcota bacterium]
MIPEINDVIEILKSNFSAIDPLPVLKAWEMAVERHRKETRVSGEPYIVHPWSVARITAEMGLDEESIAAAILHDSHADAPFLVRLERELPGFIAEVVKRLGIIRTIITSHLNEKEKDDYRKYLLAVAGDLRVILIRIADRLDNMRTLDSLPGEKQIQVASEVRSLYIPLANRMGLNAIKSELENLCFYYLEHEDFLSLDAGVKEIESSAKDYVEEVVALLETKLAEEGLNAKVYGRPKHLYSIYLKMVQKKKTLDDINDILAFRIQVDSESQCYTALGVIHAAFKPVAGTFKDYIAVPKPNGYQSLHTAVLGPRDKRMEIQVRTVEMHEIAERGVAAHWLYKERFRKVERANEMKFNELRKTADILKLKVDEGFWSLSSFQQEVFVFTPENKLVVMRNGATALDFAFNVHTQLGLKCTGTRVNGLLVPFKTVLKSGDRVEVMTNANQKPSSDWLKFVATSKAINKIKHFIRLQERIETRQRGREILEKELRRHKLSLPKLLKDGTLQKAASELRISNPEELFSAIGEGKLEPEKVFTAITGDESEVIEAPKTEPKTQDRKKKNRGIPIEVDGISNLLVRFAGCCSPLTGDPIVGYVTRGRGITIHHAHCSKIKELEPERIVTARWLAGALEGEPHVLKVVADDKPGLLVKLSETFAKQNINIRRIFTEDLKSAKAAVFFHFSTSRDNADLLIRNLRKIKGIHSVSRVSGKSIPK